MTSSSAEPQGRDRRSLPVQVYARLSQQIRSGEFEAGERLPSEAELCASYGVSRVTIRESLRMLQRELLIESRQGRGHFVLPLAVQVKKPLSELYSVTELLQQYSYAAKAVVLGVEEKPAGDLAEVLNVAPEASVIRIERVIISGDSAMVYSVDSIPAGLINERSHDWSHSILAELRKSGHEAQYSRATLRAVGTPAEVAVQYPDLELVPWLRMEQTLFTAIHQPIVYSLDFYRGDKFEFDTLRRRGG